MSEIKKKRLGDMLLSMGMISELQLEEELKKQKQTAKRLGELLIDDGIISENDMLSVLEVQLDIPRIYPELVTIEEQAVKTIPQGLAIKYNLIPISINKNYLTIAMADPLNIFALDDVQLASGYEVIPNLATSTEIKKAIDKYYSSQNVQKAVDELNKEKKDKAENTQEEQNSFDEVKNAPIVKLIDTIIDNAVKSRASDIHIEPFEDNVKVRYRIDGELQQILKVPKESLSPLIARIKILANLNIAERRIPQDGRILTQSEGSPLDLRVSILPTVNGEKTVIRILRKDGFLVDKANIGLYGDDLEKLDRIIQNPHGIILATGPTGSGKSTTLYALLKELNKSDVNIVTVEDPVEYTMDGVNQVNVNTKAGLDFASGLRSILRQDPDIIMIGEIRDDETAEIAIRAAITGHLVLSTVHTNDAPSTIYRLIDMGIEKYLVLTSLAGVISQRLVKKICPHCKTAFSADAYEKNILGYKKDEEGIIYKGTGCPRCNNTGYLGRTAVYEIMELNRSIRAGIEQGLDSDKLRDLCIENGMVTLKNNCIRMVKDGLTTLEELIKIAYVKEA